MRPALTALLCAFAFGISGCASSPITSGGGLPLGKSGWEFQGGVDFQKQIYFVYFSRPFGVKESALAAGWAK